MTQPNTTRDPAQQRTIDLVIRLAVVGGLASWCFLIVRPFLMLMVWAAIIAVAVHGPYERLQARLGQRRKVAAGLLGLALLVALAVPATMLGGSLYDGARALANEGVRIPPPPAGVAEWPLVGEPLANLWSAASQNLTLALERFKPQLRELGSALLGAVASSGLTALKLVFSLLIAAVLLVHGERGREALDALVSRLAGLQRGPELVNLARDTVRSVARGVLGVAFVQSAVLGLGFFVAGVPGAGLLALGCLVLCVTQIGPAPVALPVLIYAFSHSGPSLGTIAFTVWTVLGMLVDVPLRPILLGRGAPAPMLVIFLGSLGGLLSFGIIGLFVGAVVLCLGFRLYKAWLEAEPGISAAAGTLDVPVEPSPA